MATIGGSTTADQDINYYTFTVEAFLVDGEIIIESEYIGPNSINHEANAVFTPSDYDYDDDDASSLFGYVFCYITGFYQGDNNYYHVQKHYAYMDLNLGVTAEDIEYTCIGDNDYDDTYTSVGAIKWYDEQIDTVCSTQVEMDIYVWGFFFGHVNIEAVIYGP
ncbi:MAG: hypothetical protein ACTSUO_02715 [Candidatus Thorarchaeota archaeon]